MAGSTNERAGVFPLWPEQIISFRVLKKAILERETLFMLLGLEAALRSPPIIWNIQKAFFLLAESSKAQMSDRAMLVEFLAL